MALDAAIFEETIRSVLHGATGLEPSPCPAGGDEADADWMSATVFFSGDWQGMIRLEMPYALAQALAGRMRRQDGVQTERMLVLDGVGELANILAGNLKPALGGARRFSVPRVLEGPAFPLGALGGEPLQRSYLVDGRPFRVAVQRQITPSAARPSPPPQADSEAARKYLDARDDLPTLRASAQAVLAAVQRSDASLPEVAGLVQRDPALCARMLRMANSAFYPSVRKVSNIQLALSRMGLAEVRQLVLVTSVLEAFSGVAERMDWEGYWQHCFAAGIAARELAHPFKLLPTEQSSLGENPYFVAGLLHHLGILVEFLREPDRFNRARQWALDHGAPLAEGELKVFGFTHAEIGAALLGRWNLPEDVVHATLFHHDPNGYTGPHQRAVQAVHLAAMLCHELGTGRSYEGMAPWFSEKSYYALGWTMDTLPELKSRTLDSLSRAAVLAQA
ncbi:MAG TPA: HDOD domain-containing protein [bacterium]|nr:HDOD domain-containing protein [bacterium]